MLRSLLIGALALVCVANPIAQTAEQEVTKAEQVRMEARRKADSATLTRLASDDHLTIGPAGQVQDRKGTAALTAAPKATLGEVKTMMFGDVAITTGVQSGFGASGDQGHRFTRIWRRSNGQWLNTFGHLTRTTPSQPPSGTPLKQVPQTTWPKGSGPDEAAVLDSLRRLDDAYAKKDVAAYGPLSRKDYLRVLANGSTQSLEAFLKTVAGTPDVTRNVPNLSEFHVRVYGPVAVVAWLNKAVGGPEAGIRRSRVFVKESGSWKQLISQDTAVTPQ